MQDEDALFKDNVRDLAAVITKAWKRNEATAGDRCDESETVIERWVYEKYRSGDFDNPDRNHCRDILSDHGVLRLVRS